MGEQHAAVHLAEQEAVEAEEGQERRGRPPAQDEGQTLVTRRSTS